ncbi:MAG TPA: FAD:protein FMN transferase [Candidatus Angelobacter sp.]|jgi:thiamine biosynthesis lipoprotein|nr:FAD:protein FMN transferase [Candidatus Angelobacter sp.]
MITTPRLDSRSFTAFGGSRCSIHAVATPLDDVSACVAEVYAFEARLTRFRPDSELSRFNAAAGARVAVSPLLEELLRTCLDAHALTGGLVNAAVLPSLLAAGYDRSIEKLRRDATTARATVATGPAPALPDVLDVGDGWARLAPGCAVDLGGVGKGWLADRLAERLDNAAVNLGGDVAVQGDGPEGGGWTVGLCDRWAVALRSGGVATSGTTARRWATGHHLIDPRSGRPSQTDVLEASVVAADAATAEALGKAAILLGTCDAPRWLAEHGAAHWSLRSDGDRELRSGPA